MREPVCLGVAFVMGLAVVMMISGAAFASGKKAQHVVVVGIDGLRADAVEQAKAPNMHKLMAQGASTLKAKAVLPTVSSPNWASIIMGVLPETHKILSNEWEPSQVPSIPTIFDALHQKNKHAAIDVIYEWVGFGKLFDHKSVSFTASSLLCQVKPDPGKTAAQMMTETAVEAIKKDKPALTFIHLDLMDHAGHSHGYATPEYVAAVSEADQLLGEILQAVSEAGIADKTVVLVLADHGGKDKAHGGSSPEEVIVPWMIAGPGIAAGKTLAEPVGVEQTAPTIARILGVKPPNMWTAKPVREAFTN